jgi:hypothetical protein
MPDLEAAVKRTAHRQQLAAERYPADPPWIDRGRERIERNPQGGDQATVAGDMRARMNLRHYCRKCRSKLAEPTDNERQAFCSPGCHASFYRNRLLGDMKN